MGKENRAETWSLKQNTIMYRKFLIIAILVFVLGANTSRIVLAESQEDISVSRAKGLSPISIYDEENLRKISIEDIGKYHGDVCLCLAVSFRAVQLAILQLWGDGIPKEKDFKIISAHPGRGSQDAFEFITRAKTRKDFILELPQGTNIENLSMDNWVFTFIRKSTGARVKLFLRKDVFTRGAKRFFDLRKKAEFSKMAAKEEKEAFELAELEFKNIFMNLSLNKLFECEKQ